MCESPLGPVVLRGRDRMTGVPGEFAVRECTGCGLGVTEPRLEGAEIAPYYGEAYEPYAPPQGALARVLAAYRRRLYAGMTSRGALGRLAAAGPGRLLDVGCGRGDLAAAFGRRGWAVAGLDPSTGAVEAARAQGVDAHTGFIDDAAWPEGSFDAVIFNHSLEHIPDPVGALRRASALLRDGGRVFVAVPDWGSWQRRRFGSRWFHLELPRHLQHFDRGALERAIVAGGLRPASVRSTTSSAGLLASFQYRVFGRCVATGPWLRPALGLMAVLYPLTALVGKLFGGDTLEALAERTSSASRRID